MQELESLHGSVDNRMKTEINEFIKAVNDEMENILDELCAREILKVRETYNPLREELLKEIAIRDSVQVN